MYLRKHSGIAIFGQDFASPQASCQQFMLFESVRDEEWRRKGSPSQRALGGLLPNLLNSQTVAILTSKTINTFTLWRTVIHRVRGC